MYKFNFIKGKIRSVWQKLKSKSSALVQAGLVSTAIPNRG